MALIGESGCGKTTTAQAVLRLVVATSGAIRSTHGRIRATVEEPLSIHGLGCSRAERSERVSAALARVDLSPPELFLPRFPHELSGGQRSR